jgi:hypothetical protein
MRRILLPVVLLVAVLAGCAPTSSPVAEPTPTASATATGTPTPTSTPEPTGPPALDELVIADGGVGGFVIGMDPAAQDPVTAFMALTGTDCDAPDYWEDTYPVSPLGPENTISTIQAVTDGEGLVAALAVYGPGPTTSTGLGVGSTRADLLAAHPEAVLVANHVGRDRYALDFGSWVLAVDIVAPGGESMNSGTPVDTVRSLLVVRDLNSVGRPSFHSLGC